MLVTRNKKKKDLVAPILPTAACQECAFDKDSLRCAEKASFIGYLVKRLASLFRGSSYVPI
jgi:hypothetical protein